MHKKVLLITVVLFLIFAIAFTGCTHRNEEYLSCQYDTQAIIAAIKQSNMPDHGFRFATAEYKNNKSAYATFYITSAKNIVNQTEKVTRITQEELLDLLDTVLSASPIDLTDIYCTISLLEDKNSISAFQKKTIENYLQSLYLTEMGCYSMPNIPDNGKKELYIYPTFLVHEVASSLGIKLNPVEVYLQDVSRDLFETNTLNRSNSSSYSLLLQLLKEYKINIPTRYLDAVISMFERDFDSINHLVNMEDIYFPVYCLDYKEISFLSGYDSPYYNQIIIDCLCDGNGIKSGTIYPYDSYGLYAVARTLELANLEFGTQSTFDAIFDDFDTFYLGEGIYITPGQTTSNFVDTYYTDLIIDYLNIDIENELAIYCNINQKEIIESGVVNTCYFLELLQRNDLLNTTITDKEELATQFETVLAQLLAEPTIDQRNLPSINAAIKSIEILRGYCNIDDSATQKIISSFTNHTNPQQAVYDLCELVDFLLSVHSDDHELLSQYCLEIEEKLTNLSSSIYSNKLMLFYKAFDLFDKCDYKVSSTLINETSSLLFYSLSNYGLYKGGDSDEDVESFRNTYYGIVLTDIINQFRKEYNHEKDH